MMRRLAASINSTLSVLLLSTTFIVIFQWRQSLEQFKLRTCLLTVNSYWKLHIKGAAHPKLIPSLNDKREVCGPLQEPQGEFAFSLCLKKIHQGVEFT